MAYSDKTKVTAEMLEQRVLLECGYSYAEVAKMTNSYIEIICQRNTRIFKIDIDAAFRKRIEQHGLPSRLDIADSFGYWFSGYFDGEGCLYTSTCKTKYGIGRRIGLQISCRIDDFEILKAIQETLNVGKFWISPPRNNANAVAHWRCEDAKSLGEIILPLLDTYPLRSKKRREYELWRGLAVEQYIRSMGGASRRPGTSQNGVEEFLETVKKISDIRHMRA